MPTTTQTALPAGGSFLLEAREPAAAFSPEDFSEEHRQIRATAERFMAEEVLPVVDECEEKADGLTQELMRKAGELGLLSILVPEKYDGLELDLTSHLLAAEVLGGYAAFSTTYGAHSGIATMPLVFFGTDAQRAKYLPGLGTGETIAAYCLSEPHAGSDALAASTRAELSADGSHYLLNGQKMWITNGGWAGLYTVFAKVDGEKFTAFLVERQFEGVQPGPEEHKMGIRGSSTTPLFLDNVKVPAENVLGEIGRGHVIAFNILNLGRLKLGAACVGGSKLTLRDSIRYAKERRAFGRSISEFGAIRLKLAEMAIRTFVAESVVYRTGGLIDGRLSRVSWQEPGAAKRMLAAVEEYAVECAIVKVVASEALDYVADEGVQIHGGYGFHQDYAVERGYRDSRINRIFEGTNEINRLLTVGMLLKRAAKNRLPFMEAVTETIAGLASAEVTAGAPSGELAAERDLVERAKKVALASAGVAYQRFGAELENEQQTVYALAEIILAVYSAESALLRALKLRQSGKGEIAAQMVGVFTRDAMASIEHHAETILAACLEGSKLEQYHGTLRRLTRYSLIDVVAARRAVAERLIQTERYIV